MHYHIGTDIGTSAVKTVAFGADGTVLASASFPVTLLQPAPGHSELDPDEVLDAVQRGLQEVLSALAPVLPRSVAFSAAMHGLILMDEKDQALTRCITWADLRAAAVSDEWRRTGEARALYQRSGVPVHPMSPVCKIRWIKENDPALFIRAKRFIGIKEYVLHRLSGQYIIDSSTAAATGLMNGNTLQWDAVLLQHAGIQQAQLSDIVAPDHAVPSVAIQAVPALAAGTLLYAGASDGACATVASGITGTAAMAISVGTSGAARVMVQGFQPDEQMRTFCYHVKEDNYITGGATNNGAIVLDWLLDQMIGPVQDFSAFMDEVAAMEPGAEGLIMLPYLQGERAPIWDAKASGVFAGLTMRHRQPHLVRAAMEAVCFAVWSTGRILQERFALQEIRASGGATANAVWMQLLSDYSGLPVRTSAMHEASALGAVLLAIPDAVQMKEQHSNRIFSPDPGRHRTYQELFRKATRLQAAVSTAMNSTDNG